MFILGGEAPFASLGDNLIKLRIVQAACHSFGVLEKTILLLYNHYIPSGLSLKARLTGRAGLI
jgi:hypothetical protein